MKKLFLAGGLDSDNCHRLVYPSDCLIHTSEASLFPEILRISTSSFIHATMIKDREQLKEIERYEQYFSPQDGKHYELNWRALVLSYFTCGPNNFQVECLELVPDSISINERHHSTSYNRKISLSLYNERHPREQLDLRCNCHGFTFAGGNYFINNAQVAFLLTDEFTQVPADEALKTGDFDIVCFKEPLAGEWIHSAKHRHGKYLHKKGLHPYSSHGSIREIVGIPEYQDSIPYYFKRNAESCHGICLQPAGDLAQNLIETAGKTVMA